MSIEDKVSSAGIGQPLDPEDKDCIKAQAKEDESLVSNAKELTDVLKETLAHIGYGITSPDEQKRIAQYRKDVYGFEEDPCSYGKKSILVSICVAGGASLAFPLLAPYAVAELAHYLLQEKKEEPSAPLALQIAYSAIRQFKKVMEAPTHLPSYDWPSQEERAAREKKDSFF